MKGTTMNDQTSRTGYVDVAGGRIAYEVMGTDRWLCSPPVWPTRAAPTASSHR